MPSSIARATARSRSPGAPRMMSPPTLPQPNPSVETLRPVLPRFRNSMRAPPVRVRELFADAPCVVKPRPAALLAYNLTRRAATAWEVLDGPVLRHREQSRARATTRPRRPPERRRAGPPARRRLDGRRRPRPPGLLGSARPDPDRALGDRGPARDSALDRRQGRGLDQRLGQGALSGAAAAGGGPAGGRRRGRGGPSGREAVG